jgi:hypothetical protein
MRHAILVKLWSQVSRSFLSRTASAREAETAQNAFLAGALGVFLHLEHVVESADKAVIAATLKNLRRELNLGVRRRAPAPKPPGASISTTAGTTTKATATARRRRTDRMR